MKLVLMTLCALVVITKAQNREAVQAIRQSLDNIPVETVVKAIKNVAISFHDRREYLTEVFSEKFQDWDWGNADVIADKLMRFEHPQVKAVFLEIYYQLLDYIGVLKTTSIREVMLMVVDHEQIDKIFQFIDGADGQYSDPETLEHLILEFQKSVNDKANDMNERINHWADEVTQENTRLRRAFGDFEGFNVELEEDMMAEIIEFVQYHVELVHEKVMEQPNLRNFPMNFKRMLVKQLKFNINWSAKRVNEFNIEYYLQKYGKALNDVARGLKQYGYFTTLIVKEFLDHNGDTTVWQGLMAAKGAWMEVTRNEDFLDRLNSNLEYNYHYGMRESEEQYKESVDREMKRFAKQIEIWNEQLDDYFRLFINGYNERYFV